MTRTAFPQINLVLDSLFDDIKPLWQLREEIGEALTTKEQKKNVNKGIIKFQKAMGILLDETASLTDSHGDLTCHNLQAKIRKTEKAEKARIEGKSLKGHVQDLHYDCTRELLKYCTMSDPALFLAEVDDIVGCYNENEALIHEMNSGQYMLPIILLAVKTGDFNTLKKLCATTKPNYMSAYSASTFNGHLDGLNIDQETLPVGNTTSNLTELIRLLQVCVICHVCEFTCLPSCLSA
jgi:hypothetical protein